MTITIRTRKILWVRSGNQCAICKTELVLRSECADDPDAVVGDECHIVSQSSNFARNRNDFAGDPDNYKNLILLCKTHHKQIDDQPNKYTEKSLLDLKKEHESWVRETLDKSKTKNSDPELNDISLLRQITSGKQLVDLLCGSEIYQFDHEALGSEEETDIIASFLQDCEDYADILSDAEIGRVVQAGSYMQEQLDELEKSGFLVFGERRKRLFHIGSCKDQYDTEMQLLSINVLRESNPNIIGREAVSI